jgi:hypothetical protein
MSCGIGQYLWACRLDDATLVKVTEEAKHLCETSRSVVVTIIAHLFVPVQAQNMKGRLIRVHQNVF